MPGIEHSPESDIKLIQNDLRDRYQEGFPIIKELLQNADDAEASCLQIGWFPGFPDVSHSLLKGPALFVINDGEFKPEDQDGIRRMGISAKASDRAAIGKFGLGLKSIFHLCEAFFYLWSESHTFEILNPWYPRYHEDWEWEETPSIASAARQKVYGFLETSGLLKFPDWLCLWIPLRQRSHCEGMSHIVNKYPGDKSGRLEGILPLNSAYEISKTLPLLRNLKSVLAWNTNLDRQLEELFRVSMQTNAIRRRYQRFEECILNANRGHQFPLQGSVKVKEQSELLQCSYSGFEMMSDSNIFADLLQSEFWPKGFTSDPESGADGVIREKADAHCAAYFVETPAEGRGALRIQQAVFLPVGDPKETKSCEGKSDFTLMLHGYFLPNTGRTEIEIPKDQIVDAVNNETEVRLKWNYELFVSGTLPLIISALNRFVKEGNLSEEKVRNLTERLEKSDTFNHYRESVCRDTQWVRRLTASGTAWEQLDSSYTEILEIPPPPNGAPIRPDEVFPNLGDIASEHVITFRGDPRLTVQKKAPKWPNELLRQLLHHIPVGDVFANGEKLKYLVEFLKECAQNTSSDILHAIQRLMWEVFNSVALDQLRNNRSEIKNYLTLLKSNSCFPTPKDIFEEVFQELVQIELHVLLIPKNLISGELHQLLTESLCNEDAVKILKFISNLADNRELNTPERTLVKQVIAASHWDDIQAQCDSLNIFAAHDCRENRNVSVSLSRLKELKREGMLFAGRSTPTQATHLQQALRSESIFLIENETRTMLDWGDIAPCDESACLRVLESKPALNCPQKRFNLLDSLLPEVGCSPENSHAVRYLIHAHPTDNNLPLFMEANAGQQLWSRLASQILRLKNEQWRVMLRHLGDIIPPRLWATLGIHVLDATATTRLIREVGSERVSCTGFSTDDRQQILLSINDPGILRGLQIYHDVDGNSVRINPERTYWETDFPYEDLPRENVVILHHLPESIRWRQRQLLDRFFTAKVAISVLLETENPHQHWALILDAIDCLENIPPEYELNQKLKSVEWLPIIDTGRRPQDVIYLKDMENDVHRIVCECGGAYVSVLMLPTEFREHPGYRRMPRNIFPRRNDALAMLGEIMAKSEKYHIGDIDTQHMDLQEFLAAFVPDSPRFMPSHSMIRELRDAFGEEVCRERLLSRLCQRLPISKTVNILNFLSGRHEAVRRNRRSGILDIFNRYLKAAVKRSDFMEVLRQIKLLSRDGNWKSPTALCLDSEGIHPDDLLDEKQSEVLIDRVQTSENRGRAQSHEFLSRGGNEQQQFDESAARLEQYFDSWEGAVPSEVIGGFLSLLGNDLGLRELCEQYLGNRSVQGVRDQLNRDWEVISNSIAAGANEDIHETMERQRFLVAVVEGDTIEMMNLVGCSFHARIEPEQFSNLIIGSANEQFRYQTGMNYRVNWIRLRSVQPDQSQRRELLDLIKHSAGLLLKKVYKQALQNLDEVFDELAQNEQLDIRIAQDLLLDSAFFYVQQLEMRDTDSDLGDILQMWDRARRRKTEAEHIGDDESNRVATDELKLVRENLKCLLQSDEAMQDSLLTAIRLKIMQYQYAPQSVPFEIFQNADDAVVERFEMYGDSPSQNIDTTRFIIQEKDDNIAFIHWGRPINRFRSGQVDGRARGFDRDLEKMLILSNSDKSESTEPLTGKFGLGFKSVFLITSNPRVASGQLGFKAVGGFFPKQLTGEPLRELHRQIEACQNDGKEGTIISIQAEKCSVQECLKDFLDLVHFIPVFGRRIRRCDWIKDGQLKSWEWNDRALTQSKGVYVGEIQPQSDGQQERQTSVVFRLCQGALLVRLDSRGVVPLEKSIPTIWVTVPTKERLDLGFIVDGKFDLDVGRAQLARESKENRSVADNIGQELGNSLIELFDEADRHWNDFCANLGLAADTDGYEFWHSLWRLFSKVTQERSMNHEDANQLLHQILWKDSEHGMGRLFQQRPAVPSGLWGDYKTLTKRDEIKFKTVGVLDTELVFCQTSQWSQFQQQIEPGHVVSDKKIASVMVSLLPNESAQELRLRDLVQWELGSSYCVNPEQASQFGSLITREFLHDLHKGNQDQRNEYDELVDLLSNIRFLGRDGACHAAVDLLVKGEGADNPDEPLRAAFAPNERLLADVYSGSALGFFKACRQELRAPAQLMTSWALQATDDQIRQAVLQYIVDGELGREVASGIRKEFNATWLRNLTDLPHLTDCFNFWQRSEVFVKLQLYDGGIAPPSIFPVPPVAPPVSQDPSSVLENVHAWWIQESDCRIRRYEESVYGDFRLTLSDSRNWEDPKIRESWLTLFMLGAFQTMGRVSPQQNRSFLERCRDNGWLQVFTSPRTNHQNREAWIEILEHFLNQSGETIQFYHWMRQYVSIVQFANWLQDYRDAFLAIDKLDCQFSLTAITRHRYSSHFQGSDLNAPSVDRALGIGACFVVRELMRMGVLSSVHAQEHCYTPVRRVRKLLESIGCPDLDSNAHQRWEQSKTICRFLREHLAERATFNKAYDIPFLIIAEDEELQNKFFRSGVWQNADDEETYE